MLYSHENRILPLECIVLLFLSASTRLVRWLNSAFFYIVILPKNYPDFNSRTLDFSTSRYISRTKPCFPWICISFPPPPPDPNFSNPRLFETPQTRTNCGPVGKFTLDYFNLSKFWNHFVPILVTYASIIYTKVRTMNISKIIDQSFSVSMWQQVITHFVR